MSLDWINNIEGIKFPMETQELIQLANASHHHCLFIKDYRSNYCYANTNYIQLMGLDTLKQLQGLSNHDLSKDKKDADKYQMLDCYVLEENKPLNVSEVITPNYNQPILKTMQGTLYPLIPEQGRNKYVLGIVRPESKLLKLDLDTLFNINALELRSLLKKQRYVIKLPSRPSHFIKNGDSNLGSTITRCSCR